VRGDDAINPKISFVELKRRNLRKVAPVLVPWLLIETKRPPVWQTSGRR
jgi:hypothetical protein